MFYKLPLELQLKIFEYDNTQQGVLLRNTYYNNYYYVMDSLMDLVWLVIERFNNKKHFNINLYNYYKKNRDILPFID